MGNALRTRTLIYLTQPLSVHIRLSDMDLPHDVWRHVVSFVPDDYVRGLLGVNHTLFEIVMDELYSTVEIRRPSYRTWWILLNLQ
jgi:hypothetical protein